MKKNELTASDKRKLKQFSHNMGAYVIIGKNGVTHDTIKLLDKELERHEVVKIRCNKFKEQRQEFAEDLAKKTKSAIINIVGNVIILYRESKDNTKHVL